MEWSYSEDRKRIEIKPPKMRLRITGHRISSVLGLNQYQSEFGAWAEITKLVKLPFEDSKYTLFGKAVEPKLIDFVRNVYPNVMSIEEYYGNTFEDYRWNNFKDDSDKFGGVIDAVATRDDKKTIAMICECKTSSKPQLWKDGNVPIDYLLQGALYSYLKGLDRVLFICTFPQDIDYAHPKNYEVTKDNTIMVLKRLSEIIIPVNGEYMNIEQIMEYGSQWWDKYIETGISPEFDEKIDKQYLDIIRASKPCEDNDLSDVCDNAITLAKKIKEFEISSGLKAMKDELKVLEDNIKETMINNENYKVGKYTLKMTNKKVFDEKRLAKEQPVLYNNYVNDKITYTLSKDLKEEGDNENDND